MTHHPQTRHDRAAAVAEPTDPPSAAELTQLLCDRIALGERFAGLFAEAGPAGSAPFDAGTNGRGPSTLLTAALATPSGVDLVDAVVGREYPAITPRVPAAFWYERAIHDLFAVRPVGHPRLDPLVLPLADPEAARPRPGESAAPVVPHRPDERAVPRHVHGPGVFAIPHGPVRSGIQESVEYVVETAGEDIPHLQVRVFAKHRGIESRFTGLDLDDGVLLAERVEGISGVAHALAYCHAVEQLAGVDVPPAAAWTRTVHAELERIANHLDVVLRLSDAAGLAVATARFGWHKERVMRLRDRLCGNRFGRGVVVPGGVGDGAAPGREAAVALPRLLHEQASAISKDLDALVRTPSFLDRVRGTGPLPAQRAAAHGALGPIGRASGYLDDARSARPYDGYALMEVRPALLHGGDALARLLVRIQEVEESVRIVVLAAAELASSSGDPRHRAPVPPSTGRAVGWAEAAQGEVLYLLHVAEGRIRRCAPRSASFHNLMLFHETFAGDILTDFPFIEASFGLSVAGVVM
jgi:formate hydrogenlyase subunit 5